MLLSALAATIALVVVRQTVLVTRAESLRTDYARAYSAAVSVQHEFERMLAEDARFYYKQVFPYERPRRCDTPPQDAPAGQAGPSARFPYAMPVDDPATAASQNRLRPWPAECGAAWSYPALEAPLENWEPKDHPVRAEVLPPTPGDPILTLRVLAHHGQSETGLVVKYRPDSATALTLYSGSDVHLDDLYRGGAEVSGSVYAGGKMWLPTGDASLGRSQLYAEDGFVGRPGNSGARLFSGTAPVVPMRQVPQPPNLVAGGDMTAGLGAFTFANATGAIVEAPGRPGELALKVTPTGVSADSFASVNGDLNGGMRMGTQPGKTYTLSFDVYVPAASKAHLADSRHPAAFYNNYPSYNAQVAADPARTDEWERISVTTTLPSAATQAFARLYSGAKDPAGVVYFANIRLEEGSVAHPFKPLMEPLDPNAAPETLNIRSAHSSPLMMGALRGSVARLDTAACPTPGAPAVNYSAGPNAGLTSSLCLRAGEQVIPTDATDPVEVPQATGWLLSTDDKGQVHVYYATSALRTTGDCVIRCNVRELAAADVAADVHPGGNLPDAADPVSVWTKLGVFRYPVSGVVATDTDTFISHCRDFADPAASECSAETDTGTAGMKVKRPLTIFAGTPTAPADMYLSGPVRAEPVGDAGTPLASLGLIATGELVLPYWATPAAGTLQIDAALVAFGYGSGVNAPSLRTVPERLPARTGPSDPNWAEGMVVNGSLAAAHLGSNLPGFASARINASPSLLTFAPPSFPAFTDSYRRVSTTRLSSATVCDDRATRTPGGTHATCLGSW